MIYKQEVAPFNDKGLAHGYWEQYYLGNVDYKCNYVNDEEEGYEEMHDFSGVMTYKIFHLR